MKKTLLYLLLLPCCLFFIWYLPVSYFNVFACDDFWHGINVDNNGFWGAQSYYWYNWEGSYTHTFLATLPHVFHFSKVPFVCNILSLLIFIFSIFFFLKTFIQNSVKQNVIYSIYITALLYTFTIGACEIRFWVCANITYIFGLSTTILFVSLYHTFYFKSLPKGLLLCFLAFNIVGNKIPYIYALCLCVILHDIIYKIPSFRRTGITILLIIIFSLLNILAPGNLERLSLNMNETINYAITDVILIRLYDTLSFLKWCILLLPICIISPKRFSKQTLLFSTIALILFFIGDTIIMYICFHDPGPIRGYILIEFSCVAYMYILLNVLVNKYIINHTLLSICISLICIIIFSFAGLKNISLIEESIHFSKISTERNIYVEQTKEEIILLEPLPSSGLLLSYFCNEEEWLQYVYLPYFKKNNPVKINITSNSEK